MKPLLSDAGLRRLAADLGYGPLGADVVMSQEEAENASGPLRIIYEDRSGMGPLPAPEPPGTDDLSES